MWLCDLKRAVECIEREFGHLGMVATKVAPIGRDILIQFSSGDVIKWNSETDKTEILYEMGR